MSCGGILSAAMSIAGASTLGSIGGVSLNVNSSLVSNLGSFDSLGITTQFSNLISSAGEIIGPENLANLRTLASDVFPAVTNAIPFDVTSVLGNVAPNGFTGLIDSTAKDIMGNGDLGKFGQIYASTQGYLGQANAFVSSALNADAISSTFKTSLGGMDSLITGSVIQTTRSFNEFGLELSDLGDLIDMSDLPSLGDPVKLLSRVGALSGGEIPGLNQILGAAGVPENSLLSLTLGETDLGADIQRKIYQGMQNVTGNELDQIKNVLGVRTTGIDNLADLLDPKKLLPNTHQTLTMPTPNGLENIYVSRNSINTGLERFLQDPEAPEYTGDDPIVRARLGLPPLTESA